MRNGILGLSIFVLVPFLLKGAEPPAEYAKNWPQWRGPLANGVAPYGNPPVEWSESRNLKWKIEIPGKGHATPIIWDEQVFVLTAIETDKKGEPKPQAEMQNRPRSQRPRGPGRRRFGPPRVSTSNVYKFVILSIDRSNGKILWQRTAREEIPHQGTHGTSTWASNSPVTDGEHIYAYFGSRGLYCYDMQGNLRWEKDFGDMNIKLGFGEGSSPVLHRDRLIINWDHEGESFITVLDKRTGDEIWKVQRDERTSWATPLVVENNGKAQVITNATNHVRSYDLATGELLWQSSGMTRNAIPTPVANNDIVYVMSGFRGNALQAILLSEARGDITGSTALVWSLDRDTPYTPSPLLYDNMLYFLKRNDGILANFNAKTGEQLFGRQRLDGIEGVYASPVGADGRVYIVSRNGTAQVLKHGAQFEVLATNTLDDGFSASPAVVGNDLYLRGHKNLYCLSAK
ncbi:MAG: PQQ-binding-like beta-propeller repeat protein [bacterium]